MRNEHASRKTEPVPMAPESPSFGKFTYAVAHELNAPLRRMVNFAELLEKKYRSELDPQARHYIEVIAQNGQTAQSRLADLLQYSHVDSKPLTRQLVDCRQIIHRCLEKLKADIETREALIRVGALPKIEGDGERLELLFYCLISNALKFCKDRPDIDISARRADGFWIFSVRDRGIGIASNHYEEIFDIFHRLHREGEYAGNGMGLALARRIAELHGGEIEVESHPGDGATFYVILPQP